VSLIITTPAPGKLLIERQELLRTVGAGASIDLIHISKIISRIRLPENLESPADPHYTS
jgi:hypothetical protein